ncbi:hypothetical protein B0H14DRAFT_2572756 [Mycena olivaceomarginata]|nr:hypothetical protein B0H14DRAFT_2572756 [Mycena olivaceomarginata]
MAVEQVDGRRGKMRKKRWIPEDIRPFNGAETGYRRNKPGLTATQPSHGRRGKSARGGTHSAVSGVREIIHPRPSGRSGSSMDARPTWQAQRARRGYTEALHRGKRKWLAHTHHRGKSLSVGVRHPSRLCFRGDRRSKKAPPNSVSGFRREEPRNTDLGSPAPGPRRAKISSRKLNTNILSLSLKLSVGVTEKPGLKGGRYPTLSRGTFPRVANSEQSDVGQEF